MPILVAFPFLRPPLKEVCLKAASTDSLKFCAVPIKLAAQSNISTRVRPRVALQDGVRGGGGGYGRGYAYGRHKCVWHEMSCKSFWHHFKEHKKSRRVTRRAAARGAVWLPKVSRGWRRGWGWWEAAVISTLTSVFWEHLSRPSVRLFVESSRVWYPFGARSGAGPGESCCRQQ